MIDSSNARKFTQATLRSHFTSLRSGHLTRIMRKMPQLGISPNFFRYAPETSHNPDVNRSSSNLKDKEPRREKTLRQIP